MAGKVRFAVIAWQDAWAVATAESTADNVHEQHKPILMQTAGWVLRDDAVGISIFAERAIEEDGSYRGRTFIPRQMVQEVFEVPLPFEKRQRKAPSRSKRLAAVPQPSGLSVEGDTPARGRLAPPDPSRREPPRPTLEGEIVA